MLSERTVMFRGFFIIYIYIHDMSLQYETVIYIFNDRIDRVINAVQADRDV